LRMPPETDQRVVDFLKQHNIALAVPFGFVNSETCGQGIEGLGAPAMSIAPMLASTGSNCRCARKG
jgi:hypothetical protein